MTTVKTRINSAKGAVTTLNDTGVSIEANSANYGFSPYKVDSVNAITSTTTLVPGHAGLTTISSSTALTLTMPSASLAPGAMFTFRNLSAHAHALTGSQEVAGTLVFCDATNHGSKIALSNTVGRSVSLLCDGLSFMVLGSSGSYTISGT